MVPRTMGRTVGPSHGAASADLLSLSCRKMPQALWSQIIGPRQAQAQTIGQVMFGAARGWAGLSCPNY